jgi:polyisoprenyl-teichoic acid--peptidoglycan teichoic acid transferase
MQRALHRAAPSHRRQRRQRRRRVLMVTLVVAVGLAGVVAAGGYGYAHWRFGQIASVDVPGLAAPSPPGKPMVLLVVGSDSRAELDQPGDAAKFGTTQDADGVRSDVIMLVRADPAAHTVKILSIPRDLLVPIAGTGGRGKINAAFAGGPAQLIRTIQQQLHIPINHYLLVNFDGFRAIIGTLGGIRLDFPYPAHDALSGLQITRAGCQRLDGDQALAVARARHYRYLKDGRWHADPLSDLGRIQRQQVFLRVVLQTAIAKGLTNPVRANQFIGQVVHDLTKDRGLSEADVLGLARQFHSFDPNQLGGQTLPVVIANNYQGFGDVLLVKQPDADRAIASFLGRPPPTPATTRTPAPQVTVQVQNATGIAGLAARTTSSLRQRGVNATNAGNAPPASRSQIHYRPGQQPAAQTLAGMLAGGAVLVADASLPTGTMLVVLSAQFHGLRPAPAPTTTSAQPRDFDPHPC